MGGVQTGTVAVATAVASGVTTFNVNGYSTIVCLVGDTFTVAGETGSPTHTVTADVFVHTSTATATAISFSPAVATGGVSASSVVTFTSNSIAQVGRWSLSPSTDTGDFTSLGDKWARKQGTISRFAGTVELWLDLGDTKQSSLFQRLVAATPTLASTGFVFKVTDNKYVIGYGVVSNAGVMDERGAIVRLSVQLTGDNALSTGDLKVQWN